MSVAILVVTHECIGNELLKVTASILNDDLKNTACIEIPMNADTDEMRQAIAAAIDRLATADGVLILTDSYGSTPCNIAAEFLNATKRTMISGLNLPMLIRIMNYRSLPLEELKDIALEGGIRGITARAN